MNLLFITPKKECFENQNNEIVSKSGGYLFEHELKKLLI
jgi:hypothetical protein